MSDTPATSHPPTTPATAQRRPRLDALDALRAIAAVAVVLIHTSATVLLHTQPQSRAYAGAGLINQWSRFAVPAFVLLTGAALFYNYGQQKEFRVGRYYLRRLQSLGVPYLFWSAVYFAYTLWVERDFSQIPQRFAVTLATAGAIYTFYYFPIIVPWYVLFPLLRPLARNRWMDWAAPLAVLGNGVAIWFSFPHPKVAMGPLMSEIYSYYGNSPLWWMGPFFVGAWLVYRWESVVGWLKRTWLAWAVVSGVLFVWVMREFWTYVGMGRLAYVATNFRPSAYLYGLIIMLAAIGAGQWLQGRAQWLEDVVKSVSQYSFAIYLIHPLMMVVAGKLLSRVPLGPLPHFGLQVAVVLGLSYVGARVLELVPGGAWVIGTK